MIVLEPGVDGEALAQLGPDLANSLARKARWRRIHSTLERLLRRDTRAVVRGQVWEERRHGRRGPCFDSYHVNCMFKDEGAPRDRLEIRRLNGSYVYYVLLIPGRRGYILQRMKREQLFRDWRVVE